jgi:hypothetical protein
MASSNFTLAEGGDLHGHAAWRYRGRPHFCQQVSQTAVGGSDSFRKATIAHRSARCPTACLIRDRKTIPF